MITTCQIKKNLRCFHFFLTINNFGRIEKRNKEISGAKGFSIMGFHNIQLGTQPTLPLVATPSLEKWFHRVIWLLSPFAVQKS